MDWIFFTIIAFFPSLYSNVILFLSNVHKYLIFIFIMPFSFWVIFISTYRACFSILLMPFSFWEQFSGVLCLFFHSYYATLFLRAILRSITIVFRMDWWHYQRWRDFHESTMKRFSRVSFLFSEWTDDTINDEEIFTSIAIVFRMDWQHYQRWRDFHEYCASFPFLLCNYLAK